MNPMTEREIAEFYQKFKIVCRNCGRDDVTLDLDAGVDYGGETGYSPGTLSVGCQGCKADWLISI